MAVRVKAALFFWLGELDTCVATGDLPANTGTHDIRFCNRREEIESFLDGICEEQHREWRFQLAPYPAAGIPEWPIKITQYTYRSGECAMPAQSANSEGAYPLWAKVVTTLPGGSDPHHAILLLRDEADRVHARVVHVQNIRRLPGALRDPLVQTHGNDQCANFIDLSRDPVDVRDLPIVVGDPDEPPVEAPDAEQEEDLLAQARELNEPEETQETTTQRRRRSRKLADLMKRHYSDRCQLCTADAPRIDMGDGRYYVEIHHIKKLAETEALRADSSIVEDRQDARHFSLDRYDNVVVLCPFHHRLVHYYRSPITFDRARGRFCADDGSLTLHLVVDDHLRGVGEE